MRCLGYLAWLRQTVANVEKGRRRVTAEEVLGLALALETAVPDLMRPAGQDGDVELPNGYLLAGASVERLVGEGFNDQGLTWQSCGSVIASALGAAFALPFAACSMSARRVYRPASRVRFRPGARA